MLRYWSDSNWKRLSVQYQPINLKNWLTIDRSQSWARKPTWPHPKLYKCQSQSWQVSISTFETAVFRVPGRPAPCTCVEAQTSVPSSCSTIFARCRRWLRFSHDRPLQIFCGGTARDSHNLAHAVHLLMDNRNVLQYLRKTNKDIKCMLVLCFFSGVTRTHHKCTIYN